MYKRTKLLILLSILLVLTGCNSNNNNQPTVEERPFEDVSLDEANSYFYDVILKEDSLRQFFKSELLTDFEALENVNRFDFNIDEINVEDEAKNEFSAVFYHRYSNYEVEITFSLDKDEAVVVLYNAHIKESTYDYMDEKHAETHIQNISRYLEMDLSENENLCDRFDPSNVYCNELITIFNQAHYNVTSNHYSHHNSYLIAAFVLTNNDGSTHFSSEIQVGINDEGSFVYDLSYLKSYTFDSSNVELTNVYNELLNQVIEDVNLGKKSIQEACDAYFYSEMNCLEGFASLDDSKTNYVTSIFLETDDSYAFRLKYLSTHSFIDDVVNYRIYTTENGNIFFHQISSSNNDFDVFQQEYWEERLIESYLNGEIRYSCEGLNSPTCEENPLEPLTENVEYRVEYLTITELSGHGTLYITNTDNEDYIEVSVSFSITPLLNALGAINDPSFRIHYTWYGLENTELLYKELVRDLSGEITKEEFEQKYNNDPYLINYYNSTHESIQSIDIDDFFDSMDFRKNNNSIDLYINDEPFLVDIGILDTLYVGRSIQYSVTGFATLTDSERLDSAAETINNLIDTSITSQDACAFVAVRNPNQMLCYLFRESLQNSNLSVNATDVTNVTFAPQYIIDLYNPETGAVEESYFVTFYFTTSLVQTPAKTFTINYTVNTQSVFHLEFNKARDTVVNNEDLSQYFINPDRVTELIESGNGYIFTGNQNSMYVSGINGRFHTPFALNNSYQGYDQIFIVSHTKIINNERITMFEILTPGEYDERYNENN